MPITLDVSEETIQRTGLKPGARLALQDFRDDVNLAIITVEDVYQPDKYLPFVSWDYNTDLLAGPKRPRRSSAAIQSIQPSITFTRRSNPSMLVARSRLSPA